MKNGCNETLEAKVAERNERAKKLYRYVSDVARRVGDITSASQSIADLFSTNAEVQRQKLRDNCEKLIFLDPLNYGKKTLELLWRKVYYETVYAAKKLREAGSESDSYLFTHIVCGIGNFHHFISRLQSEMKVQFKDLDYSLLYIDEDNQDANKDPVEDEVVFARSALHSCLIYLGDLSRYQTEIINTFDPSIAARYYLQAAHLDLSLGMPYNQLGNLFLDKNYNLDSVCYYIQCLNCVTPFEGAMDNLTKIFEKNSQFHESLNESESMSQMEHIQITVANFLSLVEVWYLGKEDSNIPQRCNTIAQELKLSLEFDQAPLPDINKNYDEYTHAIEEENINPSFLNANLIHKIVMVCLFTIPKMVETDEAKAFACKAFTLALLSQLMQKLLKQLESIGLQNPASKYKPRTASIHDDEEELVEQDNKATEELPIMEPHVNGNNETDDESDNNNQDIEAEIGEDLQNGDTKTNQKKASTKRRRRRRLASSDSSDISNDESDNSDEDSKELCSEDENLSDSSFSENGSDSEDETHNGSDVEKNSDKVNGSIDKESGDEITEKIINGNVEKSVDQKDFKTNSSSDRKALNVDQLQNFLLGNNFLPSIKLLQDWALSEKDLILSCGDSGESLFQCVVDLLNIFSFNFVKKSNTENEKHEIIKYARDIANKLKLEFKGIPLPEDVNLRGTNICKFDKDAAEWQILDGYKSPYEENVIRILNFIDFGNQIAKIVPRIRYNKNLKVFYLKKNQPTKLGSKVNHKKSREWHNSKKPPLDSEGGLLRRLGRLWLASRVRELERSSGAAPAPALLALDAAALNKHLRRIKQLLKAKSFVLLVPTVVVQELDEMKREQSTARDAIRWLEVQLRGGSRYLRAQRPGQSRALPSIQPPRKAPPQIHNYVQILEYCNHFAAEGGDGDAPSLVLLAGEPADDERARLARAAGVPVQQVAEFYLRWRRAAREAER